jgi:hypothetical protein
MTLQGVKKAVNAGIASTGMAAALMFGFAPATAHADVLNDLNNEFTSGAGAGPVANLVIQSIKLRDMGFKPTKAQYGEITKALDYRPNQTPLIHALTDTVDAQTRLKKQADALAGNNQFTIGVNQYNPNNPGGVTAGPGGVNIGGGASTIGDGRSPGQSVGPPAG